MQTQHSSRIARLFGVITFLLVAIVFSRTPADADLWWHLRAGQVMCESRNILLADVFSYTRAGAPWVNAFWLSELLLYGLHALGGMFAVAAFVALTGALTFWIIYRRLPGHPIRNAFLILLTAITAAPIWGPRPQILSFLLVAVLDTWLANRPRANWILLPLFVLWANIHGGWIWGFLLLAAHIMGTFLQSLAASAETKTSLRNDALALIFWTILAALALGLNPNGLAIWKLPFTQVDVSLQIQEWHSPDFHRLDFHPFLWTLFLLILAAPFAPRPLNFPQLFKTLGFAYLTFVAQRNIALFAIVAAPLLAEWFDAFAQTLPARPRRLTPNPKPGAAASSLINLLIILMLSLAAFANLFVLTRPERIEANVPAGAVTWIRENRPEGRIFNSYNWGGYLAWSLPEYPVFIDGRADMYGDEMISQWQGVVNAGPDVFTVLEKWDINFVLLEPAWPVVPILERQGWSAAYRDRQSVILLHP